MEIDKVIEKVRKLCNMTVDNGCTEGEAIAAAEKISELMKVYNLSLDRVFLDSHKCITKTINITGQNRDFMNVCCLAIARMCDCKVWFERYIDRSSWVYFGLETDAEMAHYLHDLIKTAVKNETERFKKSDKYRKRNIHGRRLVSSFQKGMTLCIARRLRTMANQRHAEEKTESINQIFKNTGTDIVIVKRDKLESEFEKLGIRLVTHSYNYSISDHHSYTSGKDAGEKVNLNRPISGDKELCLP